MSELNKEIAKSLKNSLEPKNQKSIILPKNMSAFIFSKNELNSSFSKLSFANSEENENTAKPEHKIQLSADLNFYSQKQKFNLKMIEDIEVYMKPLKKELKKLVTLRLKFLKTLLKKGKDYRLKYD